MASAEPLQTLRYQDQTQLARLDRFLLVDFVVTVVGSLASLLVAFAYPEARAGTFFLAGMTATYAAMVIVARWLAHRGAVSHAVLVSCAGHWAIVVLLSFITPMLFPVQAMLAVMPVAIALPYVSRRTLTAIVVVSSIVSFVVAIVSQLNLDVFQLSEQLPPQLFTVFLMFFVPAISGIIFFLLWQYGSRLSDTLHETLLAYWALLKSQQQLELRVQERTAELQTRTAELEAKTRTLEEREVELADARDEALDASRAKSEFLANVSHEFRVPLTTIIGYSEMHLEDRQEIGTDQTASAEMNVLLEDLGRILQAGHHLHDLVNELLQSAEPELRLELEDFEIARLVQDVASMMQPHAARNANVFEVSCGPVGWMYADRRKLYQVLLNLVGNACKFTKTGVVRLEVTLDDEARRLRFDVSDTGIGVQPQHLNDLFQQFGSAARSTSRRFGGVGLGLFLSKQFCEAMGGRIWVKSEPGHGSTFSVLIPLNVQPPPPELVTVQKSTPDQDASTADTETSLTPREIEVANLIARGLTNQEVADTLAITQGTAQRQIAGIRAKLSGTAVSRVASWLTAQRPGSGSVLVIDDDSAVRDRLQPLLSREGFQLVYAESGEDGLELARARRPDAILLDVLLPGLDGWSVLRSLKADPNLAPIPVVMLTIVDDRQRALSLGAVDYLSKPVDREQLITTMRKFRHPISEYALKPV
jgi:signal transduction histidine kinase/DNA-binding NarL/FixJ family response regulator